MSSYDNCCNCFSFPHHRHHHHVTTTTSNSNIMKIQQQKYKTTISKTSIRSSTSTKSTSTTTSTSLQMGMWSVNNDYDNIEDRIKACIPYILPILDGDQFGRYIYIRFPLLGTIDDFLVQPFIQMYYKYPFLGVMLFATLTLGTRFVEPPIKRSLRYNAQQAALIDICLLFPELIGHNLTKDVGPNQQLPIYLVEPCKRPTQIPIISNLSETMTGPF